MKKAYAVIEMHSGAMDGWYSSKPKAQEMRGHLAQKYGVGKWIIVEGDWADCDLSIPDDAWHLNRLGANSHDR